MKDYTAIAKELGEGFGAMAGEIEAPMGAFLQLLTTGTSAGALPRKTKELIALAIAMTVRCDGCIAHHAKAVLDAGASREEMMETIGVAIAMGGGPSAVYGVEAMNAYDQFKARQEQQ